MSTKGQTVMFLQAENSNKWFSESEQWTQRSKWLASVCKAPQSDEITRKIKREKGQVKGRHLI